MPSTSTPLPAYADGASSTYTGNASTTDFTIGFDYLGKDTFSGTKTTQVRVYTGLAWDNVTENTTVRISPAPASGLLILIRRDSQLLTTRLDFADGSRITGDQLDLAYKHPLYLAQENNDRLKDIAGKMTTIGSVGNTYTMTGNGSTTTQALGSERGLTAAGLLVTVNGAFLDVSGYTVADVSNISTVTYSVAPPNGQVARVRVLSGGLLASAAPGAGSVGTTQLADGAVTLAKINLNASGSDGQALMKRSGAAAFSTIVSADVSGLQATINATVLSALAAPTGSINANSQKVVSLATPTVSTDAATKGYVDTTVATSLTGGIDQGRSYHGTFTGTNTIQTVTLGWTFDLLLVWPDFGAPGGVRGVAPSTYRLYYNGGQAYGFDQIVQSGTYGNSTQTWQFNGNYGAGTLAQSKLLLTRTSTGFTYQTLSILGTAIGGSQLFNYMAIKNSNL
jgi:hypothetical protein